MAEKGKEKVTWMKLKASLDSEKNIMKVKKALSLPQVRDQAFDEATSTVTIKVVCCSPEKVMDKLCSKGRGAIRFIETIDPPKPPAQKPKEPEKPKESEKPKPAPAQAGPSSQPVTVVHEAAPWINGGNVNHGWSHSNGYEERPIDNSYGEQPSMCTIM